MNALFAPGLTRTLTTMFQIYEYRQSGRNRAVFLAAGVTAFCLMFGWVANVSDFALLACCLVGVMIGWMLMMAPVRGIRVDDTHLILDAWRKPRPIALTDIAYLRAVHWTQNSEVTVVYRDGTEESTNPRDLPDIETIVRVMKLRGVKVKDPGLLA